METDPAADGTTFRDHVAAAAPWVAGTGVLLVLGAGLLTPAGAPELIRPLASAAMICALGALAGAVAHRSPAPKAVLAVAGVLVLILGSTFFGMSYSR